MIELAAVLRDMATELEGEGFRFAVVGGLAVTIRGTPRFTGDADLAVAAATDGQAEHLTRHLLGRGYRLHAQVEHRETGRLAIVRLVSPRSHGPNHFIVDLLFSTTGIEPEIVRAAEPAEVMPGVVLPVARRGHLIAMKVISASDKRLLDRADLLDLLRRADDGDLQMARQAVGASQATGLHRDRNLSAELEEHLRLARLPDDPTFIPRAVPPAPLP